MRDVTFPTECHRCNEELGATTTFCSCGTPTARASFKERNEWEAKQWKSHLQRSDN